MSKKKKLQQEEMERLEKQRRSSGRIKVGFTIVNPLGIPMAVAKPSFNIQMTPIVQPIAMVPYSSQQQPLLSDISDGDDY
ncbi:hypothetical protein EOM82_05760 [bacterium]|nr:hypothetical protein [bacterium]